MKWLWFSLVVAAFAGCVKPENNTQLTPINPVPAAGGSGGGAPIGGGGGAGGAATTDPFKCESIPPTTTPAMLHAEAAAVLAVPMGGTCNFMSCHVGPNGKAKLTLAGVADLNAALVGHASCQATIPLVAPGGGDAALQNSYLWQKLTAAVDPSDWALKPQTAWGPGGVTGCDIMMPAQLFGVLMPRGETKPLGESKLGPIRRWICGGAPGPQ
jgi:hypothetical protein